MTQILTNLLGNLINKDDLIIYAGQFCWSLHVDILVMEEIHISQLDFIALAVRSAFLSLQLPQVIAT